MEIMKVVWGEGGPARRTVQRRLRPPRDWCYATVKLTMDRMVAKDSWKSTRFATSSSSDPASAKSRPGEASSARCSSGPSATALTPMLKFLIEHEGSSKEEAAGSFAEFVKNVEKNKKD